MKFDIPAGRMPLDAPKPFRVEYPFGRPGDAFRRLAPDYKATCVAYHRGVDPRLLAALEPGNGYRYGPGDERYDSILADMRANGYRGGDGGRIHVHVRPDRTYVAEGNHRVRLACAAELDAVEVEVRYYGSVDEEFLLIPFDHRDPAIRVYAD